MQIHDFEIDEPTEDTEAFRIDSDAAAEWFLRKLANIEAEKQRVTQQAAKMLAALDADAQRLRHLYEGELQEYVRQELARTGNRRKSLHFLQGTAAFRTVPASVKIADVQAAKMLAALDADAQRLTRLYDGELQEYVRQELARQGNRRKSLHFLQGTTAFRTVPASVKVSDERAALAYARVSLPDAVRSVETLDTAKYREAAETALSFGEVLPGVETTPQRESFTVKFGKTD